MKLVINKYNLNFLALLAMIIWYTVPIVQEKGGMLLIALLIFVWGITCDFRSRRLAINLLLPYALMMIVLSIPLLVGSKYYGGIDTIYFMCSALLLFFPVLLFCYYDGKTTTKERAWILATFLIGIIYGAINTYIVLERHPMASRLLATSAGDEYSKMGAGGFGFAYLLMLTFPLLLRLAGKVSGWKKVAYAMLMLLIFFTLVKCEYTTCILLLFLSVAIYVLYRSNSIIGFLLILLVLICFYRWNQQFRSSRGAAHRQLLCRFYL